MIKKVIAQIESEDGWVGLGEVKGLPIWLPISIREPMALAS
jgi:hypothetical protein